MSRRLLASLALTFLTLSACKPTSGSSANRFAANPANLTIMEFVQGSEDLSMLVGAIKTAGLNPTLSSPGAFTLFAPTNAAFEQLSSDMLQSLMDVQNRDMLVTILTYHLVPGTMSSQALQGSTTVSTLHGQQAVVTVNEEGVMINSARIVMADVTVRNGIVHVIDAVLLPPSEGEPSSAAATSSQISEPSPERSGTPDVFGDSSSAPSQPNMMEPASSAAEKEVPKAMEIPAHAAAFTAYRDGIIGNGETSVLFFHASWCPSCRADDTRLQEWYGQDLPNVNTYKVDYDSASALKTQLGVIQQDTFVKIDGQGNILESMSFPSAEALQSLLGV